MTGTAIHKLHRLTGRLKVGRQGFVIELSGGEKWTLSIDDRARSYLGYVVEVQGTRTGARALSVMTCQVAAPARS